MVGIKDGGGISITKMPQSRSHQASGRGGTIKKENRVAETDIVIGETSNW